MTQKTAAKAPARRAPVTRPHSIRTTDTLWKSSKAKADESNLTMNYVVTELLEGYSRGHIKLPKITKTYEPLAGE